MTTKELYALPVDNEGWRTLPNGNKVKLGDNCTLGDYCKLGDKTTSLALVKSIIQAQPDTVVMWKWVTTDRMSPCFNSQASPLEYKIGSIVKAKGTISDQQCAPGIHVMLPGYTPEMIGLHSDTKLIPIRVEVQKKDILFAGTPGNNIKWRVRKVKVLD